MIIREEAVRAVAAARRMRRLRYAGVIALLLALLAALDLARPYAGPSLRPLQWLAGVVAVAWLAHRLGRSRRRRETLPVLALAALLVPVYVDHSRSIDSDGIHYYAYLRSLLFDGDLDLRNDYRLFEANESHKNVLPVGAPILWSPLVGLVWAGAHAARLGGAPPPTGVEPVFQAAVGLANLAYVAAGLFLLMDTLGRFTRPWGAFWATLLCWVGSPLRFYLSVIPSMAHGTEFFGAVLTLRTALALRDAPGRRTALFAGAACGVTFLTRSQDGLLLLLPMGLLAPRLLSGGTRAEAVRGLAWVAAAFAVVALPQLGVWQAMYGTPFLIPHKVLHGDAFLHLDAPQLGGTLVSPRGGVFTSHPVLLLAFLGLLTLAARDPAYVAAAMSALLGMWYLNSTVFDWYQVRRFTGIVPLLAPGLGRALQPLSRAGVVPLALCAFAVWRYDLAVDALRDQPGRSAPVQEIVRQGSDALAADVYALLEPRAPVLAVRLLAAYTGDALLDEPVSRLALGGETSVLRLPRPARHLSAPSAEGGTLVRWVQGDTQATLFLPLAWQGEVTVTLSVCPLETVQPMSMELLWNETSLGRTALEDGFRDYRFAVPPELVRLGTNALVARFDRAPVFHRVRGGGPRQIRPAALAALTLNRGAPRP